MSTTIRLANSKDTAAYLDLLKVSLAELYLSKEAYDPKWTETELAKLNETWIAEENGKILASISFLRGEEATTNPVGNLGRNLFRPESFKNGAAEALLNKMTALGTERGLMLVVRICATDHTELILWEKLGFACVGFQPLKHILRSRMGVFFYVHSAQKALGSRTSLSESLSQVSGLAGVVLENLKIPNPLIIRDGVTGYPLHSGLNIHVSSMEDFELWKMQAEGKGPREISTGSHRGLGLLRIPSPNPALRAYIGQRGSEMVAGICFLFDEHDKCIRIVDAFSADDNSLGELLQLCVKLSQEELSAAYVEVDILMNAPRLLKTADQLGFVPIAYFPAFFTVQGGHHSDVVKLLKLNMVYSRENVKLTPQAAEVVKILDNNFQDQKVGVAIVNLLRTLPIFEGLGDGELRKISRLFTQKLFRAGESIFKQGEQSNEAYIVMRGQVDICLELKTEPIATIESGQIFGEVSFLDGSGRTAKAVARIPSILLVMHRLAFNELVQREPHLGMVVIRNMAIDLSNKLRRANTTVFRKVTG